MEKNIKEFLHYYIGQRMQHASHHEPQGETYVLTIDNLKEAIEFGDVPVLRRLEDMTEDEAGEVFQLERNRYADLGGHDFDVRKEKYGFTITRLDLLEEHLMVGTRGEIYWIVDVPKKHIQSANNAPLIFHYLLSKGFDLWGLIDADLAIDAKTL